MASFDNNAFDPSAFDAGSFDLDAGATIDVKVSWIALDTAAAPCDVKVSWIALDTAAAPCDVKVSWIALDTAAGVLCDVRVSWIALDTAPADDSYILVPHPEQKAVRRKKRVKTEQQRRNEAILFILMQ